MKTAFKYYVKNASLSAEQNLATFNSLQEKVEGGQKVLL